MILGKRIIFLDFLATIVKVEQDLVMGSVEGVRLFTSLFSPF